MPTLITNKHVTKYGKLKVERSRDLNVGLAWASVVGDIGDDMARLFQVASQLLFAYSLSNLKMFETLILNKKQRNYCVLKCIEFINIINFLET